MSDIAHEARTFVAAGALGVRRTLRMPSGLVTTGIFYLLVTAVLTSLWRAAAEFNGGSVVGYSAAALVWYAATTEAAVVSLPNSLIDTIGRSIIDGDYEAELLRPSSPLVVRIGLEVGAALPRLAVCCGAGTAFAWWLVGPPPSAVGLLLAGIALVMAITINLTFQHGFGGASFWIRDSHAAWFLYQKLVFLLGGMLLPLQVLPRSLERVAEVLPFASMAYAPGRLASGNIEPGLLAIQALWLVVGIAIVRRVYTSGTNELIGATS